jgi:hypothetical protein
VIAVRPLRPRLDFNGEAPAVVVGKGLRPKSSRAVARTDSWLQEVRQPPPVTDSCGMRKEVPHGCGRQVRLRWDQPEGAKVVVCWRVEVHQALLPQLHHRDRGEGLGKRCDAKDGVLRDGRLCRDIG